MTKNHDIPVVLFVRSSERTPEDLELIFEELSEQKALAHLPNSVKRELASVVVFEAHPKSGHTRKYITLYTSALSTIILCIIIRKADDKWP